MVGRQADDLLNLTARFVRLRAGKIDLVDDGDDLEPAVDREVGVGQRLRLDTLRRIHEQQRTFARGERAGDLVREIDVAGRVDQVERRTDRRFGPCSAGGPGGP